jgi:hypothetical protein
MTFGSWMKSLLAEVTYWFGFSGALCFQFLVGGREGVYELLRISEASFILGLNFHCF